MPNKWMAAATWFAICSGLLTVPLRAQQESASITGQVTDPSGAAVPGAQVTIRNRASGVSFVSLTDTDGFYGSKHYAKALRDGKRNTQFIFGILWDMIGDSDLTITLPPDSPPEVTNGILASATALGTRQYFTYFDRQIGDDHVPLNIIARVSTVDLIDSPSSRIVMATIG